MALRVRLKPQGHVVVDDVGPFVVVVGVQQDCFCFRHCYFLSLHRWVIQSAILDFLNVISPQNTLYNPLTSVPTINHK